MRTDWQHLTALTEADSYDMLKYLMLIWITMGLHVPYSTQPAYQDKTSGKYLQLYIVADSNLFLKVLDK